MRTTTKLFIALCAATCACASSNADTVAASDTPRGTRPEVGDSAPELRLRARSGEAVDLADMRGKVVVVDFWASWCDPCRDELPVLEQFYAAHRDDGLVILGVNIDESREDADAMLRDLRVSFPVLYDTEQEVVSRWQPPKMPTSYIVGRDGTIAAIQAGFEPKHADALEARVLAQLE